MLFNKIKYNNSEILTNNKDNYIVYKIILILAIGMTALRLSSLWLGEYSINSIEGVKSYIIPLIAIGLLTLFLKMYNYLGVQWNNIEMIITKGWYIVVVAGIFFILNIMSIPLKAYDKYFTNSLIYFILTCILTGIFEEIMFRGLIQNILINKYKNHLNGVWKAILISSIIFSFLHFMNLFEKPYFILGTITQVFYTLSLGLMLGVIYYISQNIIVVITLHALFNILGSFTEIFSYTHEQMIDIPITAMIVQLILMLPGIWVAHQMYKNTYLNN